MWWRTAPCYREAVRQHVLSLCLRLEHVAEQRDVDVVVARNIVQVDQAGLKNAISVAAFALAMPAASSCYEIELLVRQFDGVSKCGHLLHVSLLCDLGGAN